MINFFLNEFINKISNLNLSVKKIFNFIKSLFILFLLLSYDGLINLNAVNTEPFMMRHVKLNNGLSIYVMPIKRIPAVLHAVIYKVGGVDDPIGKVGLAHYFEHLMFKTRGKYKDIGSIISSVGGQFNAFTTREYTCYYELVLKGDLQLAMEVEADRMANFNVSQDEIDREKNVVLEERSMRFDNNPNNLLLEEMDSAFYRTGYGRSVIGWECDIKTYTMDDVERFHSEYYHPANAILLIVGDVEFNEVIKLAGEKYSKIKAKPLVRHYPNQDPLHHANLSVTLESTESKESLLYFRYRVPLFKSMNEALAVNLAVEVLAGGKSSKLYKDLVLDKRIAVSVSAYYNNLVFTDGYVDIQVIPKIGTKLSDIERELSNSVSNFVSDGIRNIEFQRVKSKYKAEQFDNLSDLTSIAMFYVPRLALGIPFEEIDILHRKIDSITLEDINDKIRTIFSATKLVGRLLPKGGTYEDK